MDTAGTEYSKLKRYRAEVRRQRAEGRGQRAEGRICPLLSALCSVCVSERYGFVGAAGAGFCVAGGAAAGGATAGGAAGGTAGLAVGGAGAGFAVTGPAGFALVEYFPESNRLITSAVISRDGSTKIAPA